MSMDLFNSKKQKLQKLLEEKAKVQKFLTYVEKKKPKIVNDTKVKKKLGGINMCEICGAYTNYDFVLMPGESAHIFCKECTKEIEENTKKMAEINEKINKVNGNKTLTLKPNNKRQ